MELLDIYDNFGNPTGRVVVRGDKSVKLSSEEHIALAVIFIENNNCEFLIQKSSVAKGSDYTSTGGHVNSGETPLTSIKREVQEEIGLNIDNDDIISLGYLLYDMPIRFMFYLKKDVDINSLTIQETEVESVTFMPIEEITNLINNNEFLESHAKIFNEILKYKQENITR